MADLVHPDPDGPRRRPLLRSLVGDALRRRRLAQRRTLADVARHARVSVPYLSEVERGRKEASSEVLAAVCDALRIELAELLAEVGHKLAMDRAVPARPAGLLRRFDRRQPAAPQPPQPGDIVLLTETGLRRRRPTASQPQRSADIVPLTGLRRRPTTPQPQRAGDVTLRAA